jgi:hypothetical protein
MTARSAAVRAGDLSGQRGGDLILDQDVLDRSQQILGLRELQAQGVARQGLLPLQDEGLAHHRLGLIIGV